ncbi:MAG: hypothetical protein HKP11_06260 [Flavobacteriaceae bacterium]|nr:hypothetical protein [Flavobacteriaceae bacterium]
MKIVYFILLLIPMALFSQDDFSTRYYTINSESLPQLDELTVYNLKPVTPFEKIGLNNFQMNVNNYRSSVDMVSAVEQESDYVLGNVNVQEIQSEFYSFGAQKNYLTDGKTRVKNSVYKEMRGLDLLDPCPPFGICARCAPYRVGRGF